MCAANRAHETSRPVYVQPYKRLVCVIVWPGGIYGLVCVSTYSIASVLNWTELTVSSHFRTCSDLVQFSSVTMRLHVN